MANFRIRKSKYGKNFDPKKPKERSVTQQHFTASTDINKRIEKAEKMQVTPMVSATRKQPIYADVSDISDLQTALNQVNKAQSNFMAMPAKLRAEFDHDPVKFVNFCQDPKNDQKLIDLGLKPKPIPEPSHDAPKVEEANTAS